MKHRKAKRGNDYRVARSVFAVFAENDPAEEKFFAKRGDDYKRKDDLDMTRILGGARKIVIEINERGGLAAVDEIKILDKQHTAYEKQCREDKKQYMRTALGYDKHRLVKLASL